MSLTIKNAETCRLASELAELTGETKTKAITVALRQRLERKRHEASAEHRVEEMLAVARRCADSMRPGPVAVDHGDMLYDERGLPK